MSDPPQTIIVPKTSGSHGDVMAAAGLADLLGPSARIAELPGAYAVTSPAPLTETYLGGLDVSPGYPFLKANERVVVPQGAEMPVDYKQESARVKKYRELQEQSRKTPALRQDTAFLQRLGELRPRPDWRLLQVLNVLKGGDTSNQAHAAIAAAAIEQRRSWVREGLRAIASGQTYDPPWKAKLVQVFTPTAAKGYGRLKPDSTNRGDSTKERWVNPFLEWLKYRGYFRIASPYFLGSKAENIRLLCPIPTDISVQALTDVAAELRRASVYGSPPKLDSLAVLNLARLLIVHSAEYHPVGTAVFEDLLMAGRTPAQIISSVSITHYQSLGSAKAVTAITTLALPDWFPIESPQDAALWLSILDEHGRVIRGIDDSHSDEIGLLIQYRRFMEKRGDLALRSLLGFIGAYGQFLIRAREQKRRVAAFSTNNLRRITMGLQPEYTKILDDPGFLAVSSAVRRATVSAQAMKALRKEYREIRYDLVPELRRKRALSASTPFLEVVADFISAYNIENARRREVGKPAPANVKTEEFTAFCKLVEQHQASLVGALLCAFGTCRVARNGAPGEPEPGEQGLDQDGDPDTGPTDE